MPIFAKKNISTGKWFLVSLDKLEPQSTCRGRGEIRGMLLPSKHTLQ